MSYELVEASVESGTPFFLYEFSTPSKTYRFTSLSITHTVNSFSWIPRAISHGQVKRSPDISKSAIKLTTTLDGPFGDMFLGWTPEYNVTFNMYRGHEGESDTVIYWKGRITSTSFKGKNIELKCDSVFTALARYGIRDRYTRKCRHTLYHRGCNLDKNNFIYFSYVFSGTKTDLVIPNSEVDGFFTGGIIEFPDGSSRGIVDHTGNSITIQYRSRYLNDTVPITGYGMEYGNRYGGIPVTMYPGCDKLLTTCNTKFSNAPNNGGFKWIPDKNPMSGDSIA